VLLNEEADRTLWHKQLHCSTQCYRILKKADRTL